MGVNRNGARTSLDLLKKVCQLSHLPGFVQGVRAIIGEPETTELLAAWATVCTIVEALIAADNFYNRIDFVQEQEDTEDISLS